MNSCDFINRVNIYTSYIRILVLISQQGSECQVKINEFNFSVIHFKSLRARYEDFFFFLSVFIPTASSGNRERLPENVPPPWFSSHLHNSTQCEHWMHTDGMHNPRTHSLTQDLLL